MKSIVCKQTFIFRPSRKIMSREILEIPIVVKQVDGTNEAILVKTYILEAEVPFLCGKQILEMWEAKLDMKKKILETSIDGHHRQFEMVNMSGNHYGMVLETELEEKKVMYSKKTDGKMYREIRK